jgi:hypothetical protein
MPNWPAVKDELLVWLCGLSWLFILLPILALGLLGLFLLF